LLTNRPAGQGDRRMERCRLHVLGISTGTLPPGQWNAITDVPGLRVGLTTLASNGVASARTGVTAIWPRPREAAWTDAVTAGSHAFSGNGELSGLLWIAEQGLLAGPICITNTHSLGVVRDAICARAITDGAPTAWVLPVVGETYDGWLNEAGTFRSRVSTFSPPSMPARRGRSRRAMSAAARASSATSSRAAPARPRASCGSMASTTWWARSCRFGSLGEIGFKPDLPNRRLS
jgi:Peptidase family S58